MGKVILRYGNTGCKHGDGGRVNHHWHSVCSKENSSREEFAIISPLTLRISKLVGIFPTLKSTTLIKAEREKRAKMQAWINESKMQAWINESKGQK